MAEVKLYENPGFTGRSVTLGVGGHRFFTPDDFNDVAASMQVAAGFVAIIYAAADDLGGYGMYVDVMEDCADLSVYGLSKEVSYVSVFAAAHDQGTGWALVWARATGSGASFVPGHWERVQVGGQLPPNSGVGAVGPPQSPHPPNVILYENLGFTGRSVTLGIGERRFFTPDDFNDVAASIQVAA
jgi:hypothetical protein